MLLSDHLWIRISTALSSGPVSLLNLQNSGKYVYLLRIKHITKAPDVRCWCWVVERDVAPHTLLCFILLEPSGLQPASHDWSPDNLAKKSLAQKGVSYASRLKELPAVPVSAESLASAEFSLWPENRTPLPVGEGQTTSSDKKMGNFFLISALC